MNSLGQSVIWNFWSSQVFLEQTETSWTRISEKCEVRLHVQLKFWRVFIQTWNLALEGRIWNPKRGFSSKFNKLCFSSIELQVNPSIIVVDLTCSELYQLHISHVTIILRIRINARSKLIGNQLYVSISVRLLSKLRNLTSIQSKVLFHAHVFIVVIIMPDTSAMSMSINISDVLSIDAQFIMNFIAGAYLNSPVHWLISNEWTV